MIVIMHDRNTTLLRELPSVGVAFDAGQVLFASGDKVDRMYQVVLGEVQLMRHQRDGTALVLQRAGPGCLVAEASLFADRYHCDALAVRQGEARSFSRQSMKDRLAADSSFAQAWMAYLSGEVQAARARAEILSLKTVSSRLEAWLAWHDGVLPAKGTWKSIAAEIGVSAEALYREIGRRRDR